MKENFNRVKIRDAKENEHNILMELAYKSEAYWGYDLDYMNKFRSTYSVSEQFINSNPTIILEEDDNIIGFYSVIVDKSETSLEYFYIDPKYIGKGYGKTLWNYLIEDCRNRGIKEFSLVTSPQAKEFYIRMGAFICGEVESLLKKGRIIPKLNYIIEG